MALVLRPSFSEQENVDFAKHALSDTNLLDVAATWLADHNSPEDVFDYDSLAGWAAENGFKEETQ